MPFDQREYRLTKYKNLPDTRKVRFVRCTPAQLDAILILQSTVCAALTDTDLFVPTCREDLAGYLQSPHIVLGCFDGGRLIAYASIVRHGTDGCNLGYDLHFTGEKLARCANFDTIIVHPDYRGNHLQQLLIGEAEKETQNTEIETILTTVSPRNSFSLRNFQAMGYETAARKLKYGGKDRFILQKVLHP